MIFQSSALFLGWTPLIYISYFGLRGFSPTKKCALACKFRWNQMYSNATLHPPSLDQLKYPFGRRNLDGVSVKLSGFCCNFRTKRFLIRGFCLCFHESLRLFVLERNTFQIKRESAPMNICIDLSQTVMTKASKQRRRNWPEIIQRPPFRASSPLLQRAWHKSNSSDRGSESRNNPNLTKAIPSEMD
jgi:hypothetical protein